MKTEFKLVDGRIILEVRQPIWSYDSEEQETILLGSTDVTDKVMPIVDDYLDEKLGLNNYKRVNGVVTYVGKDKDKYQK